MSDKYSLFKTADDVVDYVMPFTVPGQGAPSQPASQPASKPAAKSAPAPSRQPASKPAPKKQFNPDNFTSSTDWGGYNADKFSLLPADASAPIQDVAQNIQANLNTSKKGGIVKDLQGASAKDKMQLSGAALSSAAMTAESQSTSQAVVGGIQTGLSTAAALSSFAATSAAAGPVGLAVGAASMLIGMNSAKQAKRAEADRQKKAEKAAQKSEELRLLQNFQSNRQLAINNLSQAFRRNR